ncbi:MAG: lipoate--protein ligase family protein [Actinomycetota bacterium]
MVERWRFIDAGAREAPDFFGRMPILAASVATGGPEIMMTGVFGRGHFQIGWFEDVDAVLDLDAARAQRVEVFRRPLWGGGTAFYDTNASALLSFFIHADAFGTLDEALEHFRPVMRRALDDLGLGEAKFEGSSDIRWNGRKLGTLITQAVLGTTVVGGFFNLRKPDLELYAKVARVPEEKFKDKIIKDQNEYICTPGEVRGKDLPYAEFRNAVLAAARKEKMLAFDPTGFTAEEDVGTKGFVQTVSADDWVRRVSSERFRGKAAPGARVGFANLKAKKLVRAGLELNGSVIARAMVAGDMHASPPEAMDRVAAALEGGSIDDREDLVARARAVFDTIEQPDEAAGITPEDVVEAVLLAAKNAR